MFADKPHRHTVIAYRQLAMRELRFNAARHRCHGLQIMSVEHLATCLAGEFARPIDNESLRTVIRAKCGVENVSKVGGFAAGRSVSASAVDGIAKGEQTSP